MGLSTKKIHDPLIFCADRNDVITNFAVVMNAVIKRIHCISIVQSEYFNKKQLI